METIENALEQLRKEEKRKFVQSVDLIINLKNFDARKEKVNTFIQLPEPAPKKICAFLTRKSPVVDSILEVDFEKFKTPAEIKRLAKKYDMFISVASLMPKVATKFGRVFGPMNKMPSPQAGIISFDTDEAVKLMADKMKKLIRVSSKEPCIKLSIGKEDMSNKGIAENIQAVLYAIENALPRKKENIRNVMIKFTMTKPVKINF